jgi:hypothetical protein
MDSRLLDAVIGLACFLILIVMLGFLPAAVPGNAGPAYVAAILIFFLALFGAGYLVNRQIA